MVVPETPYYRHMRGMALQTSLDELRMQMPGAQTS